MGQNLTYVAPRAVLVLLGWGATYWILTALSPHLPPAVIYFTEIAWVLAGIVCFSYIYRLRREGGFFAGSPGQQATKGDLTHGCAQRHSPVCSAT